MRQCCGALVIYSYTKRTGEWSKTAFAPHRPRGRESRRTKTMNNAQRLFLVATLAGIAITLLFPWSGWSGDGDNVRSAELTVNKEKPLGIELKVTKPTAHLSPYPFWN